MGACRWANPAPSNTIWRSHKPHREHVQKCCFICYVDHPARASMGWFHGFDVVQSKEFGAAHSVILPVGEYMYCMCLCKQSLPFVGVNAQIKYTNKHNRAWTSLQRALQVHGNKIKHLLHVTLYISFPPSSFFHHKVLCLVETVSPIAHSTHFFLTCIMKHVLNTFWRGYSQ